MPALMIAEQPKLDEETYGSMLQQLMPLLRSAHGFIAHAGGPSPGDGIRLIEVWESEADSRKFSQRSSRRLTKRSAHLVR